MITHSPHRDQLKENALLQKYYCDVNIGDLIKFNEELAHRLVTEPADIIPLVSIAARPSSIALVEADITDNHLVRERPSKMYTNHRLPARKKGRSP